MHPILFHVGWLEIPMYGVLMVAGLLAGAGVFAWLAGKAGCSRERAFEAAIETMLVAVISSKLVGLLYQDAHGVPLWKLLAQTGGVWYVGFLTGVAWAAWRMKQIGLGRRQVLDIAAAAVASGHWIGRLGCFMAGCCWGAACDLPWAVTFTSEKAHALTGVPLHLALHPTQLYESGAELLTAILLVTILRKRWYRFHLQPGLMYLSLYGIVRFSIEFFRDDVARGRAGMFSTSQWIALCVVGVSLPILLWGWRRGTILPDDAVPGGEIAAEARG